MEQFGYLLSVTAANFIFVGDDDYVPVAERIFEFLGELASATGIARCYQPYVAETLNVILPFRAEDGRVHRGRLKVGETYEDRDGTRWRWDGQHITEVP